MAGVEIKAIAISSRSHLGQSGEFRSGNDVRDSHGGLEVTSRSPLVARSSLADVTMVLFLNTEKYLNAQKNCETATMRCKVSKYQWIKVFFGSFSAQSE